MKVRCLKISLCEKKTFCVVLFVCMCVCFVCFVIIIKRHTLHVVIYSNIIPNELASKKCVQRPARHMSHMSAAITFEFFFYNSTETRRERERERY